MTEPAPGKVLVIGDDTRSFLATVRSLGRQGIAVHAAPTDFRSPALLSRFIAGVHDLPPWMGDGAEWLAAITRLLEAERFDLVIPCDERSLLPLQRHRDTLGRLARLAIPDDESIAVLFDKHATRELARRVGVPVAPGRLARADDTAQAVLADFGAPVVVKPRRSFTLDGLGTRGRVHVETTTAGLAGALARTLPQDTLIEGFFPGQGLGMSILASKGRLLQVFEHHRVHERSGASFYRISAAPDPALVACCTLVTEALGYTGVAMFEFKRNPTGAFVLLEVNARPWGSMPLPLALGVDFPYRWYRLLVHGEETPPVEYRAGIYGRNLVPDLLASVAGVQASSRSRLRLGLVMTGHLFAAARVVGGGEVQDVWVRDDPRPGQEELAQVLRRAWRRTIAWLPGTAERVRKEARAKIRAVASGGRPVRVMFVCQGNICRSPLAAALLRDRLPDPAVIEVASAGMMPRPGRPSTDLGIAAAAERGIDLVPHRSVWLTRAAAEAASVIVVFDDVNLAALGDRYPDLTVPVVKLGELAGLGDIADPIDGGLEVYQQTYIRIAKGAEALAGLLA